MKWLVLSAAMASSAWVHTMTQMEKSATKIKDSSKKIDEIAEDQINNRRLNRVAELMMSADILEEEIKASKLALEQLKRASQK